MGTIMALIMSGFFTLMNTGFDDGYFLRWFLAWIVAWVIALPLATLIGPVARKWAETLTGN